MRHEVETVHPSGYGGTQLPFLASCQHAICAGNHCLELHTSRAPSLRDMAVQQSSAWPIPYALHGGMMMQMDTKCRHG